MVSGTLKIHQNQWRVVQNQGSLENVKMASEVASRVNFGAILKHLWLPKCIFYQKSGSWKSVQKKVPSKSQKAPGTDSGQAGWLPESPPSRQRVVWIIHKKQQQFNKNTNNCTIVASIDYFCSDSWLDFDFNVDYLHEVVEEVKTSC